MRAQVKAALILLQTGQSLNVPAAIKLLQDALKAEPVAWRYRHRNEWHYLDKNDPFPTEGWDPLYAEKEK
jgi:hypothetical protein